MKTLITILVVLATAVVSGQTSKSLELLNLSPQFAECEGQLRGGGYRLSMTCYRTYDFTKLVKGKPTMTEVFTTDTFPDMGGGVIPFGLNLIDATINRTGSWHGNTYIERYERQWMDIPQSADTMMIGGLPYAYAGKSYWTQWREIKIYTVEDGAIIETYQDPFEPTAGLDNMNAVKLRYGKQAGLPDTSTRQGKSSFELYMKGMPELTGGTNPRVSMPVKERSITKNKQGQIVTSKWYYKTGISWSKSEILALTGMTELEFAKAKTFKATKITKVTQPGFLSTIASEVIRSGNNYDLVIYYNGVPSYVAGPVKFPLENRGIVSYPTFNPGIEWNLWNDKANTSLMTSWTKYSGVSDPLYPNTITLTAGNEFAATGNRSATYNAGARNAYLVVRAEHKPMTQKGVQYERVYNLKDDTQGTYLRAPGNNSIGTTFRPY